MSNWWEISIRYSIYPSTGIIGPDNGLSSVLRQTNTWTNDHLSIGHLRTYIIEIWMKKRWFLFKKMHLEMSFVSWWPFCFALECETWYQCSWCFVFGIADKELHIFTKLIFGIPPLNDDIKCTTNFTSCGRYHDIWVEKYFVALLYLDKSLTKTWHLPHAPLNPVQLIQTCSFSL